MEVFLAFNRDFSSPFDSIPRIAMAAGIVIVAVALSIFLGNHTYQLTRSLELAAAVIGILVLVFGYLAYKILGDQQ